MHVDGDRYAYIYMCMYKADSSHIHVYSLYSFGHIYNFWEAEIVHG